MATITYEDIIPPIITNTIMKKMLSDGVHKRYYISPAEGYVLHDSRSDAPEYVDGEETGNIILGYCEGTVSVPASYDFTANPYELYAVLRSTVPENQIFGGGDNNHEVM